MANEDIVHQYRPGLGSVGSYQAAGRPWITGSTMSSSMPNNGEIWIRFPYVTKSFTVTNKLASTIYIHFDSRVNTNVITQNHFISLESVNDSMTFDVKCKEVYVSVSGSATTGSFQLLAELTGIEPTNMMKLSGSGINII